MNPLVKAARAAAQSAALGGVLTINGVALTISGVALTIAG